MAGSYKRVQVPLDIKSSEVNNSVKHYPLPEPADEYQDNEIPSNAEAEDFCYSPGESPTITEGSHASYLTMSQGFTGNTTGRSSIYSLGEDEFDRQASRRVRRLFEEIDSMLFEDYHGPQNLYGECQEWVERFPHLRLLGTQSIVPQDLGFQFFPRNTQPASVNLLSDVTEQDISATHELQGLSISGNHLELKPLPTECNIASPGDTDTSNWEVEEVFAEDGFIEDIIAVDYKSTDEDSSRSNSHRDNGMPPLTPQACVINMISDTSFDIIWSEVISWLRHILRKYTQQVLIEVELAKQTIGMNVHGDLVSASLSSSPRDVLTPSREPSMMSTSRLQGEKPRILSGLQSSDSGLKLDGLLTISTKALNPREKSTLQDTDSTLSSTFPQSSLVGIRPGSGLTKFSYNRPGSVKVNDPWSRGITSARRRGRLAPIDRAKTPSEEERHMLPNEVLRGHKLATVTDTESPVPLSFPRNGALPPITFDQSEMNTNKKPSGRASSAIHDKEQRTTFRESSFITANKPSSADSNRPSTTHALIRSDTTYSMRNQSITPLGFTRSGLQGIGSVASGMQGSGAANTMTDVLSLDVRGSSINNPAVDGVNGLEETNHLNIIQPQWGADSGLSSQLRRTAKQSYNMGSVR